MAQNIVGSSFPDSAAEQLRPSKRGYGNNQFGGASSDLPGEDTRSGYLPSTGTPINSQCRTVSAEQMPATFGMRKRGS